MKNLVIVESPAKAKTIEKMLGKDFKVFASYGHVRDLPKSEMGIDTENNFEPRYIIPTKARKNLNQLKKEIEKSNYLWLATDLDREGEAIAWHIIEACREDKRDLIKKEEIRRITFDEITKEAIGEAVKNPRQINMHLVNAQQARRILDRLVGYNISPLLWKKVRRGLSAGRVQSVAVRLIVEREREVESFKPEEYWEIWAKLKKEVGSAGDLIEAKLTQIDSKKLGQFAIKNKGEAEKIKKDLEGAEYIVEKLESKLQKRNPFAPFTTSTLQQEASRKLGYSARKTMVVAQQLYEGIALENKESIGLITYMRTDSVNIAQSARDQIQNLVKENYGPEYVPAMPRIYKSLSSAQEAHEAIRPTYPGKMPEAIKDYLSPEQFKLYSLIWKRAIASQMKEAEIKTTALDIGARENKYIFRATGSQIAFDGFLKVYDLAKMEEKKISETREKEKLALEELSGTQSFTKPPARYTEASLVKKLEEEGIGRPSTYAPTMGTIQARGYIRKESKYFIPEEIGIIVNDLLVEHFPRIVDIKFTAQMEEELDEIAQNKMEWRSVIEDFYTPFRKSLDQKHDEIEKIKFPEEVTDIKCEKCGKNMVIKMGRFGKFLACSGFPECKNAKQIKSEIGVKCPKCGGEVIERRTKKGRIFYGCSNWPNCDFASWNKPLSEKCPKCGNMLVLKGRNKVKCTLCEYEEEKND